VWAEVEHPVESDPEEVEVVAGRHTLPRHLDGASDGIWGPMRQGQHLGLLRGHPHLRAARP